MEKYPAGQASAESTNFESADGGKEGDAAESYPTNKEALSATLTLIRYANQLSDPDARKLESALASFTHLVQDNIKQSLKTTAITDFFKRSNT